MLYAGRFQASRATNGAEVAVAGRTRCLVVSHNTVRAPINAEPAAGAHILIDKHHAVFPFRYGPDRTELGTSGLIAVKAHDRDEVHLELTRSLSGPDSHDPAPSGAALKG
jgi:hypothetical protein